MGEKYKREIMDATFKALSKHGYADLTIEKIAQESNKGKSLIYYHFDDKEALILRLIDYVEFRMREEFDSLGGETPEERLDDLLDLMLDVEKEGRWDFHRALMELQGRAKYSEEIAAKFSDIDDLIKSEFVEVFDQMGKERSQEKSELILSTVQGVINRKLIQNDKEGLGNIKKEIKDVAENC